MSAQFRMKDLFRGFAASAALWVAVGSVSVLAQTVDVKMATLAPTGSEWHRILREMGDRWKRESGGRVSLVLYPGGVAGDDANVVQKMRLGTIQGAALTTTGLEEVDRSILALQVPMMFGSWEEIDFVRGAMSAHFEKVYAEKGFRILDWVDAGWVQFFTKTPVRTPEDLKALKLFAWAGDAEVIQFWKSAGFHPVPLPSTEIATALQTGLVTALPTTPQIAVLLQFSNHLRNMTEVRWAAFFGAIVVRGETWERVPADARPALLAAARDAGRLLRELTRRSEPRDVAAMEKRGMTVLRLDAAQTRVWRQAAESVYPQLSRSYVPAADFEEAMRLRDEYRKKSVPEPAR
jgi:TRAP-type C4-dicarboxylate transport system substrate-binding protein